MIIYCLLCNSLVLFVTSCFFHLSSGVEVRFVVKNIGLKWKRSELKVLFCPLSSHLGAAIAGQTFLIFKVGIFATYLFEGCLLWLGLFWGVLFGRWELRNNLNRIAYVPSFIQR